MGEASPRSVTRVSDLHQRLRHDLNAALRERDRELVRVLRTILSAVANAEAQPHEPTAAPLTEGVIAGAASGVGASEVARRELAAEDVVAILRAERDEWVQSAEILASRGAAQAAVVLRADAAVVDRYLP
jgi:uncharacterized protein YqeY